MPEDDNEQRIGELLGELEASTAERSRLSAAGDRAGFIASAEQSRERIAELMSSLPTGALAAMQSRLVQADRTLQQQIEELRQD
ncbi:hypothetical protein CH276_02115 [Rhodococcus sp. 06-470-2]|jgi:hypothetical protein|uniref:hypothetical protein n=1 Tax=unclassified Rhodococcus (in: high G+C Gram-positive bacteria) TaxID=192944 RepID=UPI000B9B8031|nr:MULTISPECIES: hypothetical protein [unclassified Rhodococcus (in: high G+C Gram-positive bacteria)]OZC70211.1 hypothetical protein CH276_02115 [Rhodococcus sp. 06-470-2]OZE59756.1 hypothetical protein CH265_20515 [Rhodococcus sp. 05-2221-1B]